jgi:23S rRNA U2552 (ribose-2'-O)-methylase RlmE/FtsJ
MRNSSTAATAASVTTQREADFLVAVTLTRADDSSSIQQSQSANTYAAFTTLPALAHCAVHRVTPAVLTATSSHQQPADQCSNDLHDAVASYMDEHVACRPRSRLGMRRSTADTPQTTVTAAATMAATTSSSAGTSSIQQRSVSAPLSLCSAHTVWSDAQRAAAKESHSKVHHMSQHLHCKLALQTARRLSVGGSAQLLQVGTGSKRERLVYTQQLHKWRWNDLLGIPKTRAVHSSAERSSVAAAVLLAQAQCTQ